MPRQIHFEGKQYNFPDDATDEEVLGLLGQGSPAPEPQFSVTETAKKAASALAQEVVDAPKTAVSALKAAGRMAESGSLALGEAASAGAELVTDIVAPVLPKGIVEPVRKAAAGNVEYYKQKQQELAPKDGSVLSEGVHAGVASAASQAPGVMLSIAKGATAPGLVYAGAIEGLPAYHEARKAGKGILPSMLYMGTVGGTEAAFETLGLKYLVDSLGKVGFVKMLAGYLGRELPTELATTAAQKAEEQAYLQPDKTVAQYMEELPRELAVTGVATAVGGGVTGSAAHLIAGEPEKGRLTDGKPAQQSTQAQGEQYAVQGQGQGQNEGSRQETGAQEEVAQQVAPEADTMLMGLDELLANQVETEKTVAALREQPLSEEQMKQAESIAAVEAAVPQQTRVVNPAAATTFDGIDSITKEYDSAELGASRKVMGNEPNYAQNPNDTIARSQRPITIGTPEQVGKTLMEIEPQPGTITIGLPSADRSQDFLEAYHATVEGIRAKYMPNATIVLSNESLPTSNALGWHTQLGSGVHVITPGFLRGDRTSDERNANSQVKVWDNLNHEVTHAILAERLGEGIPAEQTAAIFALSEMGTVPTEVLQGLTPEAQGMVEEYNALRERVTSGQMTAQDFVTEWMAPWKAGQAGQKAPSIGQGFLRDIGVAPTASAMDLLRAMAHRSVFGAKTVPQNAEQYAGAIQQEINTLLSLHEYAAEQGARFAYANKTYVGTAFNTKKFFQRALQTLRMLFRDLKAQKLIRPGVKFEEWMNSLTRSEQMLADKKKLADVAMKVKALPKAKAKPAKAREAKKKAPVAEVVERPASEELRKPFTVMVNRLIASGDITSDIAQEMKEMVALGKWNELREMLADITGKKINFEKDATLANGLRQEGIRPITEEEAQTPQMMLEARKEWLQQGPKSRFVKAWFGDWENAPETASKVVSADGIPLVVFHATKAAAAVPGLKDSTMAIDEFKRGDIGFHAGTAFAAHVRGYKAESVLGVPTQEHLDSKISYVHERLAKADPSTPEGRKLIERYGQLNIIPMYLNIRNPYELGREDPDSWNNPELALQLLIEKGLDVTLDDRYKFESRWQIARTSGEHREYMSPVRQLLQDKGYDGIKYENIIEGDTSWVAFEPEQMKSLLGHMTFSQSKKLHWDKDFSTDTPEGYEAAQTVRMVERFKPGSLIRNAVRGTLSLQWSLLQLQQLAHIHPENQWLQFAADQMRLYNRVKGKLMSQPDAIARKWKYLGKEDNAKVAKYLFAEDAGGEHWTAIDETGKFGGSERMYAKLQEFGIDPTTPEGEKMVEIILGVKNSLLDHVNELERALLVTLSMQHHSANPLVRQAALQKVLMQIAEIKKVPFFPKTWFGNYSVIVQKKREEGAGWETVHKESFESAEERDKRHVELAKRMKPDERVKTMDLRDSEVTLAHVPKDFLPNVVAELGLTTEQQIRLSELMGNVNSSKLLDQYDRKRLKVSGSSEDALRSFVDFSWHNANFIAKLEYGKKMEMAIRGMRADAEALTTSTNPEDVKLRELALNAADYTQRAKDYAFNPPSELQTFRTLVTLGYLGFVPKSALLNVAGMLMPLSHAMTELGPVRGTAAFVRAAVRSMSSALIEGDDVQSKVLERGAKEGITTQSYAYHLAGMATGGNLQRLYSRSNVGRSAHAMVEASMFMFKLVEQFNRRTTLLLTYEMVDEKLRKSDQEFERDPNTVNEIAFQDADRLTELLQGDYSSGNRAPFMRGARVPVIGGLVPAATVFMTFTQMMAFHAYGGFELGERRADAVAGRKAPSPWNSYTLKVSLMLGLLAGYEGLPGMENILDLLDALYRKMFGKTARQDIREFVKELGMSPGALAHGWGHNIFGFDISGSVGFGRILPGTDTLSFPGSDLDKTIGKATVDVFGPTGGFVRALLQGKLDHFPGVVGNINAAMKWYEEGVTDSHGARITFDENGQLREITSAEIAGKALGFNPTIVSTNRELNFDKFSTKLYWETKQQELKKQHWEAVRIGDREAIADTKKAINDFALEVRKHPETKMLAITGKELHQYIKQQKKEVRLLERGKELSKKYEKLATSVEESYQSEE